MADDQPEAPLGVSPAAGFSMDFSRFDSLVRAVSTLQTRRRLLGLLPGFLVTGGIVPNADHDAVASRRSRRVRRNRRQTRHSRHRGKRKCTPQSITSVCAGTCGTVKNRKTCGRRVNCGRCATDPTCPECAANEICRNGACQTCTVTCAGNQTAAACGAALATALSDANLSTITVCPGTYEGNFTITRGVTLIGSGQGADPSANTVLSGGQSGRVLWLTADAAAVTLGHLRIIGGVLTNDVGAGVLNESTGLTMTQCTVTGNQGSNVSGVGIYSLSSLRMTGCEVSANSCANGDEGVAGGIYAQGSTTLADCSITGNSTSGEGGGILVAAGLTSLTGQTTVSNNIAAGGGGILVANGASLAVGAGCRVMHNTATELYGGIANEGAVTLEGPSPASIVVNNCPDNCLDVPGCTEDQIDCPG